MQQGQKLDSSNCLQENKACRRKEDGGGRKGEGGSGK